VDAAKAISITLVVLYHTGHWLSYAGIESGPVLQQVIDTTGGVRMPTFFFASGLFATTWIHQRSWRALVNGKLMLLAWVFLAWQLTMFVYKYAAAYTLPGQLDASLMDHVLRVLVAPLRPNAELWFLWALIVFFVLAKLLRDWSSPRVMLSAAAVSLAWSSIVVPDLGPERLRLLGGASAAPMYFVFFVTAERYRRSIRGVVSRIRVWHAAPVAAAWIVLIGTYDLLAPAREEPGVMFLEQLMGVAAGVSIAVLIAPIPAVRYLGRTTLPVYLSHTTFVVLFAIGYYVSGVHVAGPAMVVLPWLVAAGAILLGLGLDRIAGSSVLFQPPSWFRVSESARPQPALRRLSVVRRRRSGA
jgi:fucose 4-O-acetylase-like acetyltransferase